MKATPSPGDRRCEWTGILLLSLLGLISALAPRARADDDTRKKQEILFSEMKDRTVGDDPFFLVATSTAKLPVAFEIISGPAVLDGRKITLTGSPGLVIIRASQAGQLGGRSGRPSTPSVSSSFGPGPRHRGSPSSRRPRA